MFVYFFCFYFYFLYSSYSCERKKLIILSLRYLSRMILPAKHVCLLITSTQLRVAYTHNTYKSIPHIWKLKKWQNEQVTTKNNTMQLSHQPWPRLRLQDFLKFLTSHCNLFIYYFFHLIHFILFFSCPIQTIFVSRIYSRFAFYKLNNIFICITCMNIYRHVICGICQCFKMPLGKLLAIHRYQCNSWLFTWIIILSMLWITNINTCFFFYFNFHIYIFFFFSFL